MQLLLISTFFLLTCSPSYSQNLTRTPASVPPKPKRALDDQIQNGAESKPVMVFLDSLSSQSQSIQNPNKNFYPSKPLALVTLQQPIQVFEQDNPKQVAAQQVLYEFQQTPTNAVSNVHVKQLFQPPDLTESPTSLTNPNLLQSASNTVTQNQPSFGQNQPNFGHPQQSFNQPQQTTQNPLQNTPPNQFIATSETIVSPVSHNAFTNHAQNYAQISHPLYNIQPQHVQSHHYVPGKYLYVNGKIVYQPNNMNVPGAHHNNHHHQNQNNLGVHQNGLAAHQAGATVANRNHLNLMLNGNQHKNPLQGFNNRANLQSIVNANGVALRQKLAPPPQNTPPLQYNFRPPQKSQMQQITKPSSNNAPVKPVKEEKEEEPEKRPEPEEEEEPEEHDEEEEEDDDQARPSNKYEEDDDDHESYEKYHFDEDDDDDHRPDEEDDTDEDNSRDSSKQHVSKKKPKKSKANFSKSDGYKYVEGYRTNYKSESPKKGSKKKGKKPQMVYKTVKYSKKEDKPKDAEGRYSEHAPVTHKQRIIKEKWYMTRSTDE